MLPQDFITPTQQLTQEVVDNETLLGVGQSFVSRIILSEGFAAVHVLAISDVSGTLRVEESTSEDFTVSAVTESEASAVDAVTGRQFVAAIIPIAGRAVRIVWLNGASVQTLFRIRAYLIPISG